LDIFVEEDEHGNKTISLTWGLLEILNKGKRVRTCPKTS
jgi:hypothetical protein